MQASPHKTISDPMLPYVGGALGCYVSTHTIHTILYTTLYYVSTLNINILNQLHSFCTGIVFNLLTFVQGGLFNWPPP